MTKIPAIPFTMTNESITVVVKGESKTVQKGAPNFHGLKAALAAERWDDVPAHLTVARSVESWAKGKFTVSGETVSHEGKELPQALNSRIIEMARRGESPQPLLCFWERLKKNPSYRSVHQLWDFLAHQNIPLTPEGGFLAYKSVQNDYRDHHSGKYTNVPGTVNKMPRNEISDDPEVPCHEGFHVGSISYAETFHPGSRIVVCLVDPQHVVCVPKDESFGKMRVEQYKVIGNYGSKLPSTTFQEVESDYSGSSVIAVARQKKLPRKQKKAAKKTSNKMLQSTGSKLSKMDMAELMQQSIMDLRRYAYEELKIVGASKIPGGKTALIVAIMDVKRGS